MMYWSNKISKKDFLLLFSALLILPVIFFYSIFSNYFVTNTNAETTQATSKSISFADLNSDTRISIADFTIWIGYYSEFARHGKYNSAGDFNNDQRISITDFRLWLEAYIAYANNEYVPSVPGEETSNQCKSGDTLARCLVYADAGKRDYSAAITAIKNKSARDFSKTATTDEGLHATPDYSSVSATSLDGWSYYYRGAVTDNWISFAGYLWRIVRINGDGSVRLIYSGTTSNHTGTSTQIGTSAYNSADNDTRYVGYTYDNNGTETDSTIKTSIDNWYATNIKPSYEGYLSNEIFCNDRTYTTSGNNTYYGTRTRLDTNKVPSLLCTNQTDRYTLKTSGQSSISGINGAGNNLLDYPVGLLTADEASLAGGVYNTTNQNYYLNTGRIYWLGSPARYYTSGRAFVFRVSSDGYLSFADYVSTAYDVRPVLNLKSDVLYSSGKGSETDPYVIQEITQEIPSVSTPKITLSSTKETVKEGGSITVTIIVTSETDDSIPGTLTVTSEDETVVTVSPTSVSVIATPEGAETIVTVLGVVEGSSTITVGFKPIDTDSFSSAVNKTITVTVEETEDVLSATIPTTANSCQIGLVYTGNSQTLTKTEDVGYTFSDNEGTNAGDYTITATLNEGYVWTDSSTDPKSFSCSIGKATPVITLSSNTGTVEPGGNTSFVATVSAGDLLNHLEGVIEAESDNESVATVEPSSAHVEAGNGLVGTSESQLEINTTLTVTGVSAGNTMITVSFTSTDTANFENAVDKTYAVTVGTSAPNSTAIIPTAEDYCQTGLVYTGSSQTLTKAEGAGYTFSNNEGTDTGEYTIIATLIEGYKWEDNTTEEKSFMCSIDKLTPIITLSSEDGTVEVENTTTFMVTVSSGGIPNVSGTLTVSSSDTSKATVSPDSINITAIQSGVATTITVIGVADGNSTITIDFLSDDTTNFNNPESKAYGVTVSSSVVANHCSSGDTLANCLVFADAENRDFSAAITTIKNKSVRDYAAVATTDEGLHATPDYSSVSATSLDGWSYYYRGAVENNWVSFAGFLWRVVRINGDGSIRMVYSGTTSNHTGTGTQIGISRYNNNRNDVKYAGYTYDNNGAETNSLIKTEIDNWYVTNIKPNYEGYLSNEMFCNDRTNITSGSGLDSSTEYGAYTRLYTNKTPSLECTNQTDRYTLKVSGQSSISGTNGAGNNLLDYPVGLLTADEASLAGGVYNTTNQNYYLYTGAIYWLGSPYSFISYNLRVFLIESNGKVGSYFVDGVPVSGIDNGYGVRPVLNLKSSVKYASGSGTESDPYVVQETTQTLQTPTITLSSTEGTVELGNTVSFTATVSSGGSSNIKGTLTVSSGDTSKATVSPESSSVTAIQSGVATTITVTGVAAGSSTITIGFTPDETTSYNSADYKAFTITVNAAGPSLAEKIIMDDQGASSYSSSLLTTIQNKTARNFSNVATTDEGLHATPDYSSVNSTDLDGMSYYFRGAVEDNWVSFAGFLWRIVRINGDGSVRLIYSGTTSNHTGTGTQIGTSLFAGDIEEINEKEKFVGYMYQTTSENDTDSAVKTVIDTWYENNLLTNYESYLSDSGFCGDRTVEHTTSQPSQLGGDEIINYYGGANRTILNSSPTLKCSDLSRDLYTLKTSGGSSISGTSGYGNNSLKYPVGLLTADEVSFAGGHGTNENSNYYLYNGQIYWLISPGAYNEFYRVPDGMFVYSTGFIRGNSLVLSEQHGIRPVINLKSSVKWDNGDGTESNPYTVKL